MDYKFDDRVVKKTKPLKRAEMRFPKSHRAIIANAVAILFSLFLYCSAISEFFKYNAAFALIYLIVSTLFTIWF